MKKKIISVALLSLLGTSIPSHAELFDRGNGLIYDSDNNITWLADANYPKTSGFSQSGLMTWDQANAWADNLTYGGYSDWRLPLIHNAPCSIFCEPNHSEMSTFYNEIGYGGAVIPSLRTPQYNLFHNIQASVALVSFYWNNEELPSNDGYVRAYSFLIDSEIGFDKDERFNAWPVRAGDSAAPGFTPQNPILPVANSASGWQFDLTIPNELLYIDPTVAVGYDYVLDSGPNFASVLLPSVGDDQFSLYLWNGTEWTFDSMLNAGMEHAFGGAGVDRFRITGIETSAGLDPSSPTAFVTGLTFADTGHASIHMTPLVQVVPEPETYAMLIAGLGLLGWRLRSAKS